MTMSVITILLCLFTAPVVADDLTACTSFSINGSSKQNFQYYRFYDFTNLDANSAVAQNSQVKFRDRLRAANVTNSSWTEDWKIKDQLKEPSEHNDLTWRYAPQNVAIGMMNLNNVSFYANKCRDNCERCIKFGKHHHLSQPDCIVHWKPNRSRN
jgi:hypothetical protein